MNYGVYCIRDKYVGYLSPTFQENDAVAMRGFLQAIESDDVSHNIMAYKPEHFSFYRVAEFNSLTGIFTVADPFVLLCDGSSYVRKDSRNEV